jgi:hypothetical protein
LDATQEFEERLKAKFPRGLSSCFFPPKLLCRKPSHMNFKGLGRKKSCIPKAATRKNPAGFKSFKTPTIFLHSKGGLKNHSLVAYLYRTGIYVNKNDSIEYKIKCKSFILIKIHSIKGLHLPEASFFCKNFTRTQNWKLTQPG